MEAAPQLPKKPVARTEKVEDLVEMVYRGRVRVPPFQRGLKWEAKHVQELFDSVYRGYPIGSLLFYRRPADPARIQVGPLSIDAGKEPDAWWVVDGQQRLTALTACLKRPVPLPTRSDKSDPYVLYFDVEEQVFRLPSRTGDPPTTWVPLPKLLDPSDLTEWAFSWKHGKDEVLRRRLFEAGARIREYPIPLYLIETDDIGAARQIFYRTNQAGRPLEWPEVFKALFGEGRISPATLGDLGTELAKLGMGRLSEERLLTALFGLRGLDPTRTLDEHYRRNSAVLENAVSDGVSVLEQVLLFLRRDCKIPHLRLLPKPILLDVLSRFFALHPRPSVRTRALLTRWFWRIVLGAGAFDDRTLRRRGIRSIRDDDEEASVQSLLALVDPKRARPFELPATFDGRSDDNRIVLATLAHLAPLDLQTGEPLDVGELIEEQGDRAFARIVKQASIEGTRSAANRILQPKGTSVVKLLRQHHALPESRASIAQSHALSSDALALLGDGDLAGFIALRTETLTEAVRHFAARMAAWEHSDRPSIEYLLREAEAVAS